MTHEEAIKELKALAKYFDDHVPVMGGEALRMGAAALSSSMPLEQRNTIPLTLKELQRMRGDPVYVSMNCDGMDAVNGYGIVDNELECVSGLEFVLRFEDYGVWSAYRVLEHSKTK